MSSIYSKAIKLFPMCNIYEKDWGVIIYYVNGDSRTYTNEEIENKYKNYDDSDDTFNIEMINGCESANYFDMLCPPVKYDEKYELQDLVRDD